MAAEQQRPQPTKPLLTSLRLPPRTDSSPTSPLVSPGGSLFMFPAPLASASARNAAAATTSMGIAGPALVASSSSTARFHEALTSLPSSRHRPVESASSETSFQLPLHSASPTADRSFETLQRELSQPNMGDNTSSTVELVSQEPSNRPFGNQGYFSMSQSQSSSNEKTVDSFQSFAHPGDGRGDIKATPFLSGFGRPASMAMGPELDEDAGQGDTSYDFLLSPPAFDATTNSSKQMALAAADQPRNERMKERTAAPTPYRSNSDRNRPFLSQTASFSNSTPSVGASVITPLNTPRKMSSGGVSSPLMASSSLPSISQSPPSGETAFISSSTPTASAVASPVEKARSELPYQRHRSKVSSTSSFLTGTPIVPSLHSPHSSLTSVPAQPSSPATAQEEVPAPSRPQGSSSRAGHSSSSEPPISAQALLLHVLSLRSATQPMALSQSQGPASRAATPLDYTAPLNHQRIHSAGSATSDAEAESSTTHRHPGQGKFDTIDLSHKRIAEIPSGVIDELKDEAEKLALGYNLLRDLPPHFGLLGNKLRYLNVRVNILTSFPQVLCDMPSLEILDISRNKIKRLPVKPGTLLNLKVFSIAKNRVKRLPSWLAQMSSLKVLKIDHNPLEWPPKEVTVFPLGANEADASKRAASSRMEEAEEMQRWLPNLVKWLKDEAARDASRVTRDHRSDELDRIDRRRRPSVMSINADEERTGLDDRTVETRPLLQATSIPRTVSGDLLISPMTVPLPAFGTVDDDDVGISLHDDHSARHSRNASHSLARVLEPEPRPLLRSKKSLPDLRQSHADILAERRTAPPAEVDYSPKTQVDGFIANEGGNRPGLVHSISEKSALPALSTSDPVTPVTAGPPTPTSLPRSQSARPLPVTRTRSPSDSRAQSPAVAAGSSNALDFERRKGVDGDLNRAPHSAFDRNSGAYFRRLSMLPVSTISKAIPPVLLSFADAIRGILFSLSQIYASLRQFVVFASQDRLPAPIARLMGVADASMSELINALDRFDSLSRRGTPSAPIIRNIFVTCKSSVAAFVQLVRTLQPQLSTLLATADARYARTLLLMLYGSMGEIVSSWTAVIPMLDEIAEIVEDPSPAALAAQSAVLGDATSSSASAKRSAGGGKGLYRVRSKTRRHAGSFSVEDVQLGAVLPPAPVPQLPAEFAAAGGAATAPLSLPNSTDSVSGGTTLKARSGKSKGPGPLTLPPSTGYSDMIMKAFEQPMTPGVVRDLVNRDPGPVPSLPTSTVVPAQASSGATLTPSSSFSLTLPSATSSNSASGAGRPVSTANADAAFVDMAQSTITIARSVYGMLLDSFDADFAGDDEAVALLRELGTRRVKELTDLCILGNETTTKLKGALTRVRAPDSRGPLKFSSSDAKRLGDEAYAFVQTVIRFAKLVKAISLEHGFAPRIREGVGQLTIATRELAKALHTATSFRPSVSASAGGTGAGSASTAAVAAVVTGPGLTLRA